RHVDTILFTLLGGFVDECYRAGAGSPDDDFDLSIDYEVVYASSAVVSILFHRKGRCLAADDDAHDDESGLNVDLRTHRIVRLPAQFRSPRVARGLFADFDGALAAGTIFDDRSGVPDSLPGDFGG